MDPVSIAFLLVLLGVGALATSSSWMTRLGRRLVGVGEWFPVMLWLATLGLYVIALADPRRAAIPLPPLAGFIIVVGAPLAAMVLTLAWRDARRGEVEVDPEPEYADAPVSDGTRVAAGVVAVLCAAGFILAILEKEWRDAGLMVSVGAIAGSVAITGQAPAGFRGSI